VLRGYSSDIPSVFCYITLKEIVGKEFLYCGGAEVLVVKH
jgi:hypothetical protein